jgi:hypothetical protein
MSAAPGLSLSVRRATFIGVGYMVAAEPSL